MLSMMICQSGVLGSSLNGLGKEPFMGWSTWNLCAVKNHAEYGGGWLNSTNVLAQSDAMRSKLGRFGFNYLNIDSFWSNDPTQDVDEYGRQTVDLQRFPKGMEPIIAHAHANGQKLGLYINPGLPKAAVTKNTKIEGTDCHARDIVVMPLENGNVFGDTWKIDFSKECAMAWVLSEAKMFAEWGVDFLKMDAVSPGSWNNNIDCKPDVQAWAMALNQTGRPIWFELSWSLNVDDIAFWKKYSNGWRVDGDVDCYCDTLVSWDSVQRRFKDVLPFIGYGSPGGWNDLDSIVVGNAEELNGLNPIEKRTTVTLWAITCAQWYLGGDLTTYDDYGISLVTHPGILKINKGGVSAAPIASSTDTLQIWTASYPDGHHIVAFFNLGNPTWALNFSLSRLNITGTRQVTNVWSGASMGTISTINALVPSHGTLLVNIQ